MSINKVLLLGNVGKDPVIRYFDKGVAKATFPLATSETYTNQQGETITSTEWHNIVLWRALAEVAEKSVKKGIQVYVVGKIKTRSYVDKDGNNKYITEILADTMMVMEKKQGQNSFSVPAEDSGADSKKRGGYTPEVNEPIPPYQAPGVNHSRNQAEKGSADNDNPGSGEPFNMGPGNGQNEDDLPF
jgi:single-strand DNA-binding protein